MLNILLFAMVSSFVKVFEDETTAEELKSIISPTGITLIIAVASFVKKCKPLVKQIKSSLENDFVEDCGNLNKPSVVVVDAENDEVGELISDLGIKSFPSYQIYRDGRKIFASVDDSKVTYDKIRSSLKDATINESCCEPSDKDDILKLVAESYAKAVRKTSSLCESVDSTLNGYSIEDIAKAGADSNLGLGCGNPLSFSGLKMGETVVDLGSGAGIDCFIASGKVGTSGKVIGVDMTPDMVFAARKNAKKNKSSNVQFRLGEIEYLPIQDNSADCVISNCVINLSPDKPQVFREIYRILRKGGRIAISDVVVRPQQVIPDRLKTAEALAC